MGMGKVKVNQPRSGNPLLQGRCEEKAGSQSVTRGPIFTASPFEWPQSLTCAFLNGQTRDVLKVIIAPSLPPMKKCAVPFLSKARHRCLSLSTIQGLLEYVCALCIDTRSSEMPSFRNQMYFRKSNLIFVNKGF